MAPQPQAVLHEGVQPVPRPKLLLEDPLHVGQAEPAVGVEGAVDGVEAEAGLGAAGGGGASVAGEAEPALGRTLTLAFVTRATLLRDREEPLKNCPSKLQ
jgi:hypothetical protein